MKNKKLLIVAGVLGVGILGLLLFKNKKSKDLQTQLKLILIKRSRKKPMYKQSL
jgi:hypothetical protein